jgi:predicted DNA binding protein
MGLLAEFDIDCEHLPLVSVARAVPEASLRLDLQFNHGEQPLFVLTVTGGSRAPVEHAIDDADDAGEWTHIGRAGDTHRYQIRPALSMTEQLGDHLDDLSGLEALASAAATIDRIEVRPGGWRQTGWFADRDAFEEFRAFWQRNVGFRLHRLTRDGDPEPPGEGLTDPQREALRTAYELGYFEVPRRTSLEAVGTELGVSASAASERLRRAQTQVIEERMATAWPPLPD